MSGAATKDNRQLEINSHLPIIVAPIIKKGTAVKARMLMATAAWSISLVIQVMRDGVPILSSSAPESRLMCAKKITPHKVCRSPERPLAAKY